MGFPGSRTRQNESDDVHVPVGKAATWMGFHWLAQGYSWEAEIFKEQEKQPRYAQMSGRSGARKAGQVRVGRGAH